MEAFGVIVLGVFAVVISITAYSAQKWTKRCFGELRSVNAHLARISNQSGIPQQAIYRLVATRTEATPDGQASEVSGKPHPT